MININNYIFNVYLVRGLAGGQGDKALRQGIPYDWWTNKNAAWRMKHSTENGH